MAAARESAIPEIALQRWHRVRFARRHYRRCVGLEVIAAEGALIGQAHNFGRSRPSVFEEKASSLRSIGALGDALDRPLSTSKAEPHA